MPTDITVLVPTRDPGSGLDTLVRSLDAQSLPLSAFEVVFADAGSTDGSVDRLARLGGNRPNVSVVDAPAGTPEDDLLRSALGRAAGRWVVVLRPGDQLAPRALELLVRTGDDAALTAVAGRATSGSGAPGCTAHRRAPLLEGRDPVAVLTAPETDRTPVVAVDGAACVVAPYEKPQTPVTLREPSLTWAEGVLTVSVRVAGVRPVGAMLVLAHAGTGAELLQTAAVEPVAEGASGAAGEAHVLRAAVDPRTAELGDGLGEGVWRLRFRVRGDASGEDVDVTVPVPRVRAASAVLDGDLFVPIHARGGEELDVAATRTSVVNRTDLEAATVVESARGFLATLPYPQLHVRGDAVVPGTLVLGTFRLPARLVCASGTAVLECWVSGLAGRSTVEVQVGRGKAVRTGLDLVISGAGRMTLEPTPPPPPDEQPAAAVQEKKAAPATLVQRLRHRVPAPLEPAVRRLSRSEPLRRAYRAVAVR